MKKRSVILLLYLVICFSVLMLMPFILGDETDSATTTFTIQSNERIVIDNPENITYFFEYGDDYLMNLNVRAISFTPTDWRYSLWQVENNSLIYSDVSFFPNITFEAVNGLNKLIVSANSSGRVISKTVFFTIQTSNVAPVLGPIDSVISICENDELKYDFYATDIDAELMNLDISPKNPFFVFPNSFYGQYRVDSQIISPILTKERIGNYNEQISVDDGEFVDLKNILIEVIEINNAPVVQPIGVQTIWTQGENSTFEKRFMVEDVEDGNEYSGNFDFSLDFHGKKELFEISSNGLMNYIGNVSDLGIYNVTVCAEDRPLVSPHVNISLCGQDGSSISSCNDFSITVTNENRPPTITDYYSKEAELWIDEGHSLYFNLTKFDPDGTIPDTYWYFDDNLIEYDQGNSSVDDFTFSFGYSTQGRHIITGKITDGDLNTSFDYVEWIINVKDVEVLETPRSGGGGGGGGGCVPEWACLDWGLCENAKAGLTLGDLTGEEYRLVSTECYLNFLDVNTCGFQNRICNDLKNCNTTIKMPNMTQSCEFVENPTCLDGVKNCHDGACEIAVDCGGPCDDCLTCSDGIKNQGEDGIDCGGPCVNECVIQSPLEKYSWLQVLVWLMIIIVLVIIIIKVIRIYQYRRTIKERELVYE